MSAERPTRILLVEDDASIVLGLRVNLRAEGYEVEVAEDGEAGLALAREGFDLLLLDVMMPKVNGFELLRKLRAEGIRTPAILLTALSSETDKVTGLDLGAEDYVTKPFGIAELLARIRAVLRRAGRTPPERHRFGDVVVDPAERSVHRGQEAIELTRTEFDILLALVEAGGKVVTRKELVDLVWGPGHKVTLRTVDNFVAQLRAKLEPDPKAPRHLLTVRGVGYRFQA